MILLHNIGDRRHGSNYNSREEILACKDRLSFDGIYLNVHANQDILAGKDVTLFVMGDHVGKDNSFDVGQPLERYCTWEQIRELQDRLGARLGWHTWTHRNLCELSDDEIIRELTPPFKMDLLAYPYGNVDARVERWVRELGYAEAWSVTQGDGSQFQRRRRYLNW